MNEESAGCGLEGQEAHVESQLALNAVGRTRRRDRRNLLNLQLLVVVVIDWGIIRSCDLVRLATRLLNLTGGVGLVEFQDGVLDGVAVPASGTVVSTVLLFLLSVHVDGEVSVILFIVMRVRVSV